MYKLVIPSILALQGKAGGFRSGKGGGEGGVEGNPGALGA